MKQRIKLRNLFILLLSLLMFVSCGEEELKPDERKAEEPIVAEVKEDSVKDTSSTLSEENLQSSKTEDDVGTSGIPSSYVVQEGETLELIAEKFYGSSGYWFNIFAENETRINNWNYIYPGQELELPQIN